MGVIFQGLRVTHCLFTDTIDAFLAPKAPDSGQEGKLKEKHYRHGRYETTDMDVILFHCVTDMDVAEYRHGRCKKVS